jgi:phage terminase small subunit
MTEAVQRFCDRYFETLNGTQSAIYAGFSENTARSQASQMLDTQEVQDYLTNLRNALAEKTGISQQKVLNEIAKIAFSDIRNYYEGDGQLKNITDLDDNEAAALASIKSYEEIEPRSGIVLGVNKEIKIYDKLAGLEKLARHLGMYKEDNKQRSQPIQLLNFDPINAVTGNDSPTEDIGTTEAH